MPAKVQYLLERLFTLLDQLNSCLVPLAGLDVTRTAANVISATRPREFWRVVRV